MPQVLIQLAISAVLMAVSYGLQAALAPNPRRPTLSGGIDRLRNVARDNTAPLRIVYGTARTSGVLFYSESADINGVVRKGGVYLHAGIMFAHGPIEDIYDVQLNDEPANSTRFAHLATFVPFFGHVDQPPFRGPVQLRASRTNGTAQTVQLPQEWLDGGARPGRQIAYLWCVLRHHIDIFPGGAPTIRATIKGRLVYDPRQDSTNGGTGAQRRDDATTWRWSNNAALCIRDFLASREYGMGIPDAQIDDAATRAAADVCDQLINAPSDRASAEDPMPQIARYTIDGLFETDEVPINTLERLLQAMNGGLLFYGGQYHLKAGAVEPRATDATTAANITITPDDLRGDADIQITRMPGRKDRVNTVRGTFINPAKNYVPDQFPEATNAELLAEDGHNELALQVQLDFTQHPDRANYIASVTLKRERLMRWSMPLNASAAQLIPLSQVGVTHPHFGWTDKPALIRDRVRLPNGAVTLVLEEYADATWDQEINPAKFPRPTELPNPFDILPPTGVAIAEATHVNPDGTRVAKAVLTWTEPTNGNADGYVVSWRGLADTATQSRRIAAPATRFEITGLAIGSYTVSIRSQLPGGTQSEPVTVQVSITYATTAPPDPVDVRAAQLPNGTRVLTWAPSGGVLPPDLIGWEVRVAAGSVAATVEAWTAARRITLAPDTRLETQQPVAPGDYTFLIRSLDAVGYYSNGVGSVQVTLAPELPDIVLDREFWEEGWPVRIGTDAAATGEIVDAVVNAEGHLEGTGEDTWDDAGTWDDPGAWNAGSGTLVYTSPIYDLGADRAVTIQTRAAANAGAVAQVRVRMKRDDDPWGGFGSAAGGVGRFIQFRVTVFHATEAPRLERLAVRVRERRATEYLNDLAMGTYAPPLRRAEQTAGDWQDGPWQVNIRPEPTTGTNARAIIDPEPSLVLDGSSWIGAADHLAHRFPTGALTIEATVKLDTLAQDAVIIGKGTDWRLVLVSGVGVRLMVNNALVTGFVIPITDAVPLYHLAVTYAGGVLVGYRNRVAVAGRTGNLVIPGSTAVLRAGADQSGGNTLEGVVEDLRLWSYARSAEEIARDAASPVPRLAPGLVLWWRCADGTGATVRDLGPLRHDGTVTGTATWHRIAYRESPPIPLALLPRWRSGRVAYTGALGVGGSIDVTYSVDDGVTWTAITDVPTAVAGLTIGEDPAGKTFRCRQLLRSTVPANSPAIERITVSLQYDRAPGDLVVMPREPFGRLDQAVVAAIQDPTGRVPSWALVAKDAAAARFRVTDREGVPFDTTVDVQLAGARLAA